MNELVLLLPFLVMLLLVVTVILLGLRKWRCSIVLGVLTLAVNAWSEAFALYPFCYFFNKEEGNIGVMTLNVHANAAEYGERWNKIANLIIESESDVVLLNEFETQYNRFDDMLDSTLRKYYPFSTKGMFEQKNTIFYSKYPFSHFDSIMTGDKKYVPLIQLKVKDKMLTAVGCHLSSNNYIDSQNRFDVDSIKSKEDAKLYWNTIKKGYAQRRGEVDSIYNKLVADNELNHLIILGDVNDIGGSYSIGHLESLGLSNAWWKGGFGYGGTRDVSSFSFRLDHVLYGNGFDLKGVKVIDTNGLSDHNAVVARFDVK